MKKIVLIIASAFLAIIFHFAFQPHPLVICFLLLFYIAFTTAITYWIIANISALKEKVGFFDVSAFFKERPNKFPKTKAFLKLIVLFCFTFAIINILASTIEYLFNTI